MLATSFLPAFSLETTQAILSLDASEQNVQKEETFARATVALTSFRDLSWRITAGQEKEYPIQLSVPADGTRCQTALS